MTIEYIPTSGFIIDSFSFNWSDPRELIREKLNQKHKEDDRVIELAKYFDGDVSQNIHQYRDIYENYKAAENYFFLSYDENGLLSEVEIHWGISIKVYDQILIFDTPIQIFLDNLSLYDDTTHETEEGNYLLPKLKMSIATSEAMGGNGDGLSYFYAGKNIDHLIE